LLTLNESSWSGVQGSQRRARQSSRRWVGFAVDATRRDPGLPNAQLAFELRHLGGEHGTDRLHCLRSPVGMPLDCRADLLHVLPGRIDCVVEAVRPGLRDIDITSLAQCEGQKLGSEQGIFLGASARVGTISPFMPRHLQQRTLNRGDHLSLLIEINGPGGFYTEIARTIVLGHASNQLLDGFENVREAQVHTLGQIKPGVSCRDVAQAHDDYMRARGLPPETRLYAHGQGYDMVERPLIRANPCVLKRGCVLPSIPVMRRRRYLR
jgi:hypothetical protein